MIWYFYTFWNVLFLKDIFTEYSILYWQVFFCFVLFFKFCRVYYDELYNLCIYFLAVSGLSCGTQDLLLWHAGYSLQCVGFSLVVAHMLQSTHSPEHMVVVCGLSCPTACGILVHWPGIKLASPALQDGFSTTGPPGKSLAGFLLFSIFLSFFFPLKTTFHLFSWNPWFHWEVSRNS